MQRKERIGWVDASKGVGILMVMFGHNWLDSIYTFYFYAFHMPLFFILSGYTFSYKLSFLEFIKKKAKVLLIPYLFFVVCYLCFYGLCSITHDGDFNIFAEIVAFFLQQRHTYLWFLVVLFQAEIVMFFLCKYNLLSKKSLCIGVLTLLILTHYILYKTDNVNLVFNSDLVPLATTFIVVGYLYKMHFSNLLYEKNRLAIFSIFIFFFSISTINYIYNGYIDIFSNKYGYLPFYYLSSITGTFFTVIFIKQLPQNKWLILIGKNSLLLYGFHRIIIEILFIFWNKFVLYDGTSLISVIIAIINVVLSCVIILILGSFINKRCPWLLGKF